MDDQPSAFQIRVVLALGAQFVLPRFLSGPVGKPDRHAEALVFGDIVLEEFPPAIAPVGRLRVRLAAHVARIIPGAADAFRLYLFELPGQLLFRELA